MHGPQDVVAAMETLRLAISFDSFERLSTLEKLR
jgi:hypothetical protein